MAKRPNIAIGPDSSYKNFLESVELYALGLDTLSAELKRGEYAKASLQRSPKVIHNIKTEFVVSEFKADFFDISGQLTLEVGNRAGKPPLRIHLEYSAHFHSSADGLSREHAERFAEIEARLIFWPYFRQTISDLTARMHIRPLVIPLSI